MKPGPENPSFSDQASSRHGRQKPSEIAETVLEERGSLDLNHKLRLSYDSVSNFGRNH